MTTTTRYGISLPDEITPNDVPTHLATVANGIANIMATCYSGTYAARPAAGVLGRYYNVTDNTTNGGLHFDNGSAWIRVTPSPWVTWTPTVTVVNDSGVSLAGTINNSVTSSTFIHRTLPGSQVEVLIEAQVSFSGSYGTYFGIAFSTPISSARYFPLKGEYDSDIARVRAGDLGVLGNVISVYPHGGFAARAWQFNNSGVYMGDWYTDGNYRLLLASGTYPV
jgi:hypothetical protein